MRIFLGNLLDFSKKTDLPVLLCYVFFYSLTVQQLQPTGDPPRPAVQLLLRLLPDGILPPLRSAGRPLLQEPLCCLQQADRRPEDGATGLSAAAATDAAATEAAAFQHGSRQGSCRWLQPWCACLKSP